MVLLMRCLCASKESRIPRKFLRTKFLDSARIHVKGGSGGTGLPKYGGLGGQGGCVYCVGRESADLKTIFQKHRTKSICAGHGEDSRKLKIVGAPGQDVQLEVPLGVTVYREDGKVLGEINQPDETCILARGGPGGNQENNFLGHAGQMHHVRLDLRLIADIGLVGFPNAGKSSLLKAISRAKPRIANYPFTTLKPNIGIIHFKDHRQISMADLPGLIEGAHVNVGLGHKFLKHVERTKMLLLVADLQGFALSPKHAARSCLETVMLLNKELELYNSELLDKPAVLALNKMDLPGSTQIFDQVKRALQNTSTAPHEVPEEIRPERVMKFEDIIGISAMQHGDSIETLKLILRKRLDQFAEDNNPEMLNVRDLLKKNRAILRERGSQIT